MLSSALLLLLALVTATLSLDSGRNDVPQEPLIRPDSSFYITAVTNYPTTPYNARFQCWLLDSPFSTYPTVGISVSLGAVDNMTYVLLPPRSAEGWHRPPHAMFFVLLSGVAQVYVPKGNYPRHTNAQQRLPDVHDDKGPAQPFPNNEMWDTITISPGSVQQVLIAADTDARSPGHLTFYPGDGETVALQIPLRDGGLERMGHRVVHEGGCTGDEQSLSA